MQVIENRQIDRYNFLHFYARITQIRQLVHIKKEYEMKNGIVHIIIQINVLDQVPNIYKASTITYEQKHKYFM